MKRAKKTAKKTVSTSNYIFKVEKDWSPTRGTWRNGYMEAVVNTAVTLIAGESFAVPFAEIVSKCGYATGGSAASSIRSAIKKRIGSKVGEYNTYVIKDNANKVVAIRVRKN